MDELQGCKQIFTNWVWFLCFLWIYVDCSLVSVLVAGMVSLWSLAVVAFERWLVVCKPLGNFIFKPDHALACCASTWICAMVVSAPPLFGWSRSV